MERQELEATIAHITRDLGRNHPKAVILFGSAARFLQGVQEQPPLDIDLLYAGSISPIDKHDYGIPTDLFFFNVHELLAIAKALRYLPSSVSRAKMFLKDSWKGYVRTDIAACLLLGPAYAEYGFLQMENEAAYRDYSVQTVVLGKRWWRALQQYAREQRGVKGLAIDKVLGLDQFTEPE